VVAALPWRFAGLLRSQWYPPSRLAALQRAKLATLIDHAYHHVPYYRDAMDARGIKPDTIRDVDDLALLPVTTKADLLAAGTQAFLADDHVPADCEMLRTSGSLGMPLEIVYRRADRSWWAAQALRGWLANGYRPQHTMLVLNDSRHAPRGRRWFERAGLFRQEFVSIYQTPEQQLEVALALQPDVIRGMTSDVRALSKAAQARPDTRLRPRLVLTSAELMDDATRTLIEQVFGVAPVDFYGSMECGWIANQCPQQRGYHVNAECLIVEIIRNGRPALPGERGEVVVTNLQARAMPFIRYSVGDVAVVAEKPCVCGRGLPLIRAVEGRLVDCLTTEDGRSISPYQVTLALESIPGLQQYQVVQTDARHLSVRFVPGDGFNNDSDCRIRTGLQALCPEFSIDPQPVATLTADASGKFRVVSNRCRQADAVAQRSASPL
jgi:phenylacetate-CoA ligase